MSACPPTPGDCRPPAEAANFFRRFPPRPARLRSRPRPVKLTQRGRRTPPFSPGPAAMDTTAKPSIDEGARKRFEAAWRAGRPEPVERFLPPEEVPHFLATL